MLEKGATWLVAKLEPQLQHEDPLDEVATQVVQEVIPRGNPAEGTRQDALATIVAPGGVPGVGYGLGHRCQYRRRELLPQPSMALNPRWSSSCANLNVQEIGEPLLDDPRSF